MANLPSPLTRAGYALEWAAQAHLTKRQAALFFLIVRQTLLWGISWDWLSSSYIERHTGISKSHASEAISELEAMGVLRRVWRVVPKLKDRRPKLCLEICESFACSSVIRDGKREQQVPGSGNSSVPGSGNKQKHRVTEELVQATLSSLLHSEETRVREIESPPESLPMTAMIAPPSDPVSHPAAQILAAFDAWLPLSLNTTLAGQVAQLGREFEPEAVLQAISEAQRSGIVPKSPVWYLRERLRSPVGLSIVPLVNVSDATGIENASGAPDAKRICRALLGSLLLPAFPESAQDALAHAEALIAERQRGISHEASREKAVAAILEVAERVGALDFWADRITGMAAFRKHFTTLCGKVARMARKRGSTVDAVSSMSSEQDERQRKFAAYKASLINPQS